MKSNIRCCVLSLLTFGAAIVSSRAAVFDIPSGDIGALKAAITASNGNGQDDVINLAGGVWTFTAADDSLNALPLIGADGGHSVIINGNRATLARYSSNTPEFRLLQLSAGANMTLSELTLSNGQVSETGGGAIYNDHANLTMVDCTVAGNMVHTSGIETARGGAIFNAGGTIALLRCTFVRNEASGFGISSASAGGGAIHNGGTLTVQLCTFSDNGARASKTTSTGSTETYGGALVNFGTAAIANSTFANNFCDGTGQHGTAIYTATANAVELGNCIVAGTAPVFYGGIVSRGYNLTNATSDGLLVNVGDQFGADPQLTPLADYGGLTKTCALQPGSAAIDKGKRNTVSGLAAATDQRGQPRPYDYPGIAPAPGGDSSDIGAFELRKDAAQSGSLLSVTMTADHDDGVCGVEDCTLREAINLANANGTANRITFAFGARGTIQLAEALPNLSTNMTIDGPGANRLAVRRDSGGDYRIFNIGNGTATGPIITLAGLTITNGRAPGGGNGGGILNDRGALRIERCAVSQNAGGNGGGIYSTGGSLTIVDSTINGNSGTGLGGGIFTRGAESNALCNIGNVTFSANSSPNGAAIYNGSSLAVQNATFSGDTSPYGVICTDGLHASTAVRNSIFSPGANTASLVNLDGSKTTSFGHNIAADSAGGDSGTGPGGLLNQSTDKRNTDPKFDGGLRDNGGATATIALQSISAAVNTGDQNSAPTRDQRGFVRAGIADIGAFEFGATLPTTLANISTRLRVQTGDNVLIGGFIVTGSQSKRLLIRALGPSLPLSGKLNNPQLQVYNSAGQVVAKNDNWRSTQEAAIIATSAAPRHDLEAAVTGPVDPGAYTVVVSGVNGSTGIAVVEVYDLDRTSGSKLANIATRGFVQTGDNVMIGGFIVLGPDSQRLIVRALGPSIPLPNKLANPTLELFDGNGTRIGSNNDWRSTQQNEIIAAGVAPGSDLEAAIVKTVAPGSYTAIVRGANQATGVAVVEVYALD